MPSRDRRHVAFLITVAAACVCASGCARHTPTAPPAMMRIGTGGIAQASTRTSGVAGVISNLTTDTWLTSKADGRQDKRIVTDWSWDQSNTILHLKIRDDVYFHDGTKLTSAIAADVLRQSAAHARKEGAFGFTSVKSVGVTGPATLDLHLSEPNGFVLTDLTGLNVRKPENEDIGTGPFMLVRQDEQQAVLTAFPKYYRGRPQLGEIDVVSYSTQRSAWAELMRGKIDMLYEVSRDAADFVNAESTVKTYTFERPYYIALVFNVRHPVLKRVEVRKAINEALDRATLVHDGLNDQGRVADGPIWPEHWARPTQTPQFSYKPDDARRLLDAAGLKATRTAAGTVPSRFSFTCLVYAEDNRFERVALLVQKQLADVGIEMNLQPLKGKEFGPRVANGNFDAFIVEFFGRSLAFAYDFWRSHEGGLFDSGYVSADRALDRVRSAVSDQETKAAVTDLTRVLHDDPPAAFLAWQSTTRAVSTRFDVETERGRDIFINASKWRVSGAQQP